MFYALEVKAQVQSSAVVWKERYASQKYAQAQLQNYWTYCVLEGGKQSTVFTEFERAQSSKVWYLLCFGRLSRAKYAMYGIFEGSAEQKHSIYSGFGGSTCSRAMLDC